MREVKSKEYNPYLPLTFEAMLNHLHTRSEQAHARKKIQDPRDSSFSAERVEGDVQGFEEIFRKNEVGGTEDLHADNSFFCKSIRERIADKRAGTAYNKGHTDTMSKV